MSVDADADADARCEYGLSHFPEKSIAFNYPVSSNFTVQNGWISAFCELLLQQKKNEVKCAFAG